MVKTKYYSWRLSVLAIAAAPGLVACVNAGAIETDAPAGDAGAGVGGKQESNSKADGAPGKVDNAWLARLRPNGQNGEALWLHEWGDEYYDVVTDIEVDEFGAVWHASEASGNTQLQCGPPIGSGHAAAVAAIVKFSP
jgi:hypothetical protein